MAVRGEVESFEKYIFSSIDRLLALLGELSASDLNWRPPAQDANSIYTLAAHVQANAEENILHTLFGEPYDRDHEAEFGAVGTSSQLLRAHWESLRSRLTAGFARLDSAALDREYSHPRRGTLPGREILLIVARHAAEHLGQAELTRDLARQPLAIGTSGKTPSP